MVLPSGLISEFVKVTNDKTEVKTESTHYGTIVEHEGSQYVRIDGSDLLTPATTTTKYQNGERVIVMIKNHEAVVTGNLTSPSTTSKEVDDKIGSAITEVEVLIADKVSTKELEAESGRIDNLVSDNILVKEKLTATEAEIGELQAENVTITGKLDAQEATIEVLETEKLSAKDADIKYATIEELEATDAYIHNLEADYGEFKDLTTDKFTAQEASIKDLEVGKLSATDADLKYANIDFANINFAAVEKIFADSGIIKDLVTSSGTVTGELVGVTIKGDLIEGGTVVAEKLVIKGTDGLYYKLNTDGVKTETEQTDYNSLNGSIITAKSITATKISVDDLVAFGATIGGFHITEDSLYSGAKASIDNTTRGIYMDDDGQFALGDADSFLRYFKDTDGSYKLEIAAKSIKLGASSKTVEETIDELRDEMTTNLRIESSRGTVFKNSAVSTVLSAVIYRGSQRITDITTLRSAMGSSAYLQWKWQKLDEDTFGVISASDSRLGNNGFTFTLSPSDVDTKVTFMCELIV